MGQKTVFLICREHMRLKPAVTWFPITEWFLKKLTTVTLRNAECDECKGGTKCQRTSSNGRDTGRAYRTDNHPRP